MTSRDRLLAELARSKKFRAEFVKSHTKRLLPLQIQELMEQRGYSQNKLAKLSDLSQSTIHRAVDPEYGNLAVNTCVNIAEGFDVAFIGAFVPYSRFLEWLDEEEGLVEIPAFHDEFDEVGEPRKEVAAARAERDKNLLTVDDATGCPRAASSEAFSSSSVTEGVSLTPPEKERPNIHHALCNVLLSLVNPLRGCTCGRAERLEAQVKALQEYVQHKPDCDAVQTKFLVPPCSCGLAKLLTDQGDTGRSR